MSKNLTQEYHIFLIRDGRGYVVTEVEKLVGWTARFQLHWCRRRKALRHDTDDVRAILGRPR